MNHMVIMIPPTISKLLLTESRITLLLHHLILTTNSTSIIMVVLVTPVETIKIIQAINIVPWASPKKLPSLQLCLMVAVIMDMVVGIVTAITMLPQHRLQLLRMPQLPPHTNVCKMRRILMPQLPKPTRSLSAAQ